MHIVGLPGAVSWLEREYVDYLSSGNIQKRLSKYLEALFHGLEIDGGHIRLPTDLVSLK